MIAGKHFPGSAKSGLHLISDKERTVSRTKFSRLRQKVVRRNKHTMTYYRLHNQGSDIIP